MLDILGTSIYFILPAYIANTSPVFAAKLKLPLGQPISQKKFGKHKTYRGFYSGFIGALLTLLMQEYLEKELILEHFRLIDYAAENIFILAFSFGIGAIGGDLVKSFFKRKLKISEGRPWPPFDQLDLVIGALLLTYPIYQLEGKYILTLLIVSPLIHVLTNILGYKLGLKKVWW